MSHTAAQADTIMSTPVVYPRNGLSRKGRKNRFLPNKKSPSTLWWRRQVYRHLLRRVLSQNHVLPQLNQVAEKTYVEESYELLSSEDKAAWTEIAALFREAEESFKFVPFETLLEKVHESTTRLQKDTLKAFGIITLTMIFIPGHGTNPPSVHTIMVTPRGKLSFDKWLKQNHPESYDQFKALQQEYLDSLWRPDRKSKYGDEIDELEEPRDEEKREKEHESVAEADPLLPVNAVHDGIRIFKDLRKLGTVWNTRTAYSALVFDRWTWAGHKGSRVGWTRIERDYENLVNVDVVPMVYGESPVPRRARLCAPNNMIKADLDAWILFFANHQDGLIPWGEGMLFKRGNAPQPSKGNKEEAFNSLLPQDPTLDIKPSI